MPRHTIPILLLILLAACRDSSSTDVRRAECRVSVDTLSFGYVSTPTFGWEADYRTLQFTITNAGDAVLSGSVSVRVKPDGPRHAKFHLSPKDTDPRFSIEPGESKTLTIGVTMENASAGEYVGEVDLGTACGVIPITLTGIPSQ